MMPEHASTVRVEGFRACLGCGKLEIRGRGVSPIKARPAKSLRGPPMSGH